MQPGGLSGEVPSVPFGSGEAPSGGGGAWTIHLVPPRGVPRAPSGCGKGVTRSNHRHLSVIKNTGKLHKSGKKIGSAC